MSKMAKRKSVNYINNADLLYAMEQWLNNRKALLDAGKQAPEIPRYIGEAIMLIANRLARKGNFSGYSFREEMVSDGIENCIMYLHNFNPAKSKNPFGYISLILHNAYIRRIEKESKHSYIKHKLMFNNSMFNGIGEFDKSDLDIIGSVMESSQNEKSGDVISKFEDRLKDKKEKKARKDAEKLIDDLESRREWEDETDFHNEKSD